MSAYSLAALLMELPSTAPMADSSRQAFQSRSALPAS
jgi:hypothetical protein